MTRMQWNQAGLVKQGRRILDSVTMGVSGGELVGLVGPNGAGKTALLRLAVGLDRPSAGSVLLEGEEVGRLAASARARRLAFLPQQAEAAWPIRVRDAVMLGRLPHGDGDEEAVTQALAAVDMEGQGERLLTRLSGGERALVLLARALAVGAPTVLLDEPTANLDPAHQLQVMDVLRRRAEQGDAVVVVLHDLALASRFCDRLLVLHQGRLAAEGNGAAILDDPLLRQVFGITVERGHVQGRPIFLPSARVA